MNANCKLKATHMNCTAPQFRSWLQQIDPSRRRLTVDLAAERFPNHVVVIECSIFVVENGVLDNDEVVKGIVSFVNHNQVPIFHQSWLSVIALFDKIHSSIFVETEFGWFLVDLLHRLNTTSTLRLTKYSRFSEQFWWSPVFSNG